MVSIWLLPCVTALFLWPPSSSRRTSVCYRIACAAYLCMLSVLHGVTPSWALSLPAGFAAVIHLLHGYPTGAKRLCRAVGAVLILLLLDWQFERRMSLFHPFHLPFTLLESIFLLLSVAMLAERIPQTLFLWSAVFLVQFTGSWLTDQLPTDGSITFWLVELGLSCLLSIRQFAASRPMSDGITRSDG
ncbi:hypothetical protein [Alicyclobacillus acidiphilus]|uniref:hypothetical protein n=1 Tax=Alicyclobacillus acidiphilus TaxID=182455 RepID=UPI000836ECF2|nr:hypothetical protein [Alicyclobacillus acidiphilus]